MTQAGFTRVQVVVSVVLALVVGACGGGAAATGAPGGSVIPSPAPDAVNVVATTTVFADLVREAGGAAVRVTSLVPAGGDPHTYAPTPSDVRSIAGADLVVMNGLGVDDWLKPLVAEAKRPLSALVELGPDEPGVTYLAGIGGAAAGGAGAVNPHLWLNVAYAELYVQRIVAALQAAAPAKQAALRVSGDAYLARLAALDAAIRAQIATLPAANRKLVSYHDAFPYFAAAYGLTIVGTVVPAPGQDPSAGQVVALIQTIRASGVKAIFSEAQFNPKVEQQLAAEAGVTVVSNLYNDALGAPPLDTYEAIMRWNADRVVEALR
ncbi:MAG TPA: metal ABC transporter substrate-binding protein [Candidatus Limnocylindrales bacterium]